MYIIRFLPFAIFVMWSGFLFLDLRWVSNVWMRQWFHSTISIQNSKNSTITKKHAKGKWKSHSARGRVIEWMLNNCWVACPWNGMTYFVWFLRRKLLTYLIWFLSLCTLFTHQAIQIEESSYSLLIIRWPYIMYKVFLNLSGNVIIDYLSDYKFNASFSNDYQYRLC